MGSVRTKHKIFLTTSCLLAAAPIAKIGDVQLLEIFFFFHLLWLLVALSFRHFRIRLNDLWRSLGRYYAIFFILVLTFAFASLRFRFYPAQQEFSLIKLPFMLSLARSVEIFLGVFHMLYIASILLNDSSTRLYTIRCFFWTGFMTAAFSLLSCPVLLSTGLMLGVYSPNMRARGLFNEGGPYGLYLICIMVAGILLYRIGGLTRRKLLFAAVVILPVFFLAQSKAAIIACLVLFLLNIFLAGSFRLRASLLVTAALFVLVILTLTDFNSNFMAYVEGYEIVQEAGTNLDQSAYGGFGGRLAGAILVPRMIAAHPLTGIGLGNYPLLFNDPHYLQGLPFTANWELPGLGIVGYIPELGIPLFVYLLVILCVPPWLAYRRKSAPIVLIFASIQILVHLFGTQLNFYYPWICSGMALSFLDVNIPKKATRRSRSIRFLPSPLSAIVSSHGTALPLQEPTHTPNNR